MRITGALGALLIGLCQLPATAWSAPTKVVKSKITAVTVYADRARVTRSATVDLGAGRFRIAGLPGWIDHESVRVKVTPATRGRIVDVTAKTTYLAKASDAAIRKAAEAVREINDKLAELSDERRVIEAEIAQLEAVRAFSMKKLPRDMAVRRVKLKTIGETIDFITNRLRKARTALRSVAQKRRSLLPVLAARRKVSADLARHAKLQQTEVTVEVKGAGRVNLSLSYLTPGATWEPTSELRADGSAKAGLVQYASVIQTTGEDWSGAKLTFSTQRPADTLQVPAAQVFSLGGRSRPLRTGLSRLQKSFTRASSAYYRRNALIHDKNLQANIRRQRRIQHRSIAVFRKLHKRSTTAHFRALSSRPVRPNGKVVRVAIARATFQMKPRLVAVPAVSLNAVRTAELTNTTSLPVLPGRLALFVGGSFIGRSVLKFVAPGEKFSAYLGVNDRIKLARKLDRRRSSFKRGRKTTEMTVSYLVSAENLGRESVTLDLADRVPVSENAAIEIDDIETPKGARRSSDGLVRWTVTLRPGQKRVWRVGYEIEYPTRLLAVGRKARARKRYRNRRRPVNAPRTKTYLFDDLDILEQQLK